MAEPLTLVVGGYIFSQASNVMAGVVAARVDEYMVKPFFDRHVNHDIQKALHTAWGKACKDTFRVYRKGWSEYHRLSAQNRTLVKEREKLFIKEVEQLFVPLDELANEDVMVFFNAERDTVNNHLLAGLKQRGLWDGLPEGLQGVLSQNLLNGVIFYFIEIGIKRDSKARDAIFFQQFMALRQEIGKNEAQMKVLWPKVEAKFKLLDDYQRWERDILTKIEAATERIDQKTERIDQKTERIDQKAERIDQKAERIDATTSRIEAQVGGVGDQVSQLGDQMDALKQGLDQLIKNFDNASIGIRDQIYDFTRYIGEKTHGFVGRQWVFGRVNKFIDDNPRGYYFIIGEPGIGKSALAAQLVQRDGYIHHFNIRAEGINKASAFLQNVCAQLIATYELDYNVLPPRATEDAGILNKLLDEVSKKLAPGKQCVIVIDALDEVDSIGPSGGANLLYLPMTLPKGVYIVVTMRDKPEIMPHVVCERGELRIDADSSHNYEDVTGFVQKADTVREGIERYILTQGLETQEFVLLIVDKSEGNFMYLRYVLPEIEKGAYKDRELKAIPKGLQKYYDDHWLRMKGEDKDAWFDYKLPIIMAVTQVKKPVSIDLIADFSGIKQQAHIWDVLEQWTQFLHEEELSYEEGSQKRYRIYHASFHDFIARKEQVKGERVDRGLAHAKIADNLWGDLFGDE